MKSREQEEKILKETKLLVELFLETGLSDIELSKQTGISSSTVGRRLTNAFNIKKIYPDNGDELYEQIMFKRQENLHNGKVLGGQISVIRNTPLKDRNGKFKGSFSKLRLDFFYQNKEKQMKLLKHMALTFRAKPPLLSELFGFTEEEIINYLYESTPNSLSIKYLIENDFSDQMDAKDKIIAFYCDLLDAAKGFDVERVNELIKRVFDFHAHEVIIKRKNNELLNSDDFGEIVKYQLKYALKQKDVCSIFGLEPNYFRTRLSKYLAENEELKERYNALTDFNSIYFWENYGKKR